MMIRCWICGTEIMMEDPNPDTDPLRMEAQRRGDLAWTDWSEVDIASMYFEKPYAWAFFLTTVEVLRAPSFDTPFPPPLRDPADPYLQYDHIARISPERYNTYRNNGPYRIFNLGEGTRKIPITYRNTPTKYHKGIFTLPIHERCLCLVDHVFGTPRAIDQVLQFCIPMSGNWLVTLASAGDKDKYFRYDSSISHKERDTYNEYLQQKDGRKFELPANSDKHPHDPVNIPELRDAIVRARTGKQRETESQMPVMSSVWQCNIPYDLQVEILDRIESTNDIKHVLSVFGWQMSGHYWKHRFPKNVIMEYADLVLHEINWEYLFFAVMDLMDTSSGLRNRVRIIGLLERLKRQAES